MVLPFTVSPGPANPIGTSVQNIGCELPTKLSFELDEFLYPVVFPTGSTNLLLCYALVLPHNQKKKKRIGLLQMARQRCTNLSVAHT